MKPTPPARCTLVALEMGSLNRHYHALWFLFLYFENCTNFMKKKPSNVFKEKIARYQTHEMSFGLVQGSVCITGQTVILLPALA